ncbi:MAG: hypothetical protein CMH57_10345 [Myxococcales bacterium]|nr:hypothetical protein [Myxococcales bacterium]
MTHTLIRTTSPALLLLALLTLGGCPGLGDEELEGTLSEVPDSPTYDEHVAAITAAYCNKCHSDPPSNGAPGSVRTDICEGGAQMWSERFAARIGDLGRPMPPSSEVDRPSDIDIQTVQRWHEQGARCTPQDTAMSDAGMDTETADTGTGMQDTTPDSQRFQDEVLPIFTANSCLQEGCHAPAGGFVSGGLELTSEQAAMAGGSSGAVVVRCDPDDSLLIQKLRPETLPGSSLMPIGDDQVSDADLDTLKAWIADGADMPGTCQ